MTDAEWIESFESKQGMGACIVEGQEIAAVVRALEAARRTATGLSDAFIAETAYKQFGIVAQDDEVVSFVRAILAAKEKES